MKYTPDGGLVTLRCGQVPSGGAGQAWVEVEDNGPGIADDQIDRIFQPLTTTKTGGMGLGLSVTRTIVESHGGRLHVSRSALGGAAFSFNLIREAVGEYT